MNLIEIFEFEGCCFFEIQNQIDKHNIEIFKYTMRYVPLQNVSASFPFYHFRREGILR